jgi:hypothetical protein
VLIGNSFSANDNSSKLMTMKAMVTVVGQGLVKPSVNFIIVAQTISASPAPIKYIQAMRPPSIVVQVGAKPF